MDDIGIAENFNDTYKDYNIYVIGVGGTGSQLLPLLYQRFGLDTSRNIKIFLIDGDSVEEKNMRNQRFVKNEIGFAKAMTLARRYSTLYPRIATKFYDFYIETPKRLLDIIEGNFTTDLIRKKEMLNIVIGCVDNNATRKILHDVFLDSVTPIIYIDSGNGAEKRRGQCIIGVNTPYSYQEPICELYPEILDDPETIDKALSCQVIIGEKPQNIATNAMAAMVIFNVINNLSISGEIEAHEIIFNCEEHITKVIRRSVRY